MGPFSFRVHRMGLTAKRFNNIARGQYSPQCFPAPAGACPSGAEDWPLRPPPCKFAFSSVAARPGGPGSDCEKCKRGREAAFQRDQSFAPLGQAQRGASPTAIIIHSRNFTNTHFRCPTFFANSVARLDQPDHRRCEPAPASLMERPRTVRCGFRPYGGQPARRPPGGADGLRRFQRAGHRPIAWSAARRA